MCKTPLNPVGAPPEAAEFPKELLVPRLHEINISHPSSEETGSLLSQRPGFLTLLSI